MVKFMATTEPSAVIPPWIWMVGSQLSLAHTLPPVRYAAFGDPSGWIAFVLARQRYASGLVGLAALLPLMSTRSPSGDTASGMLTRAAGERGDR